MENDLFSKESCYGTADDDAKKIRLQKMGPTAKTCEEDGKTLVIPIDITDTMVVETFYHELCHIIFDALGESELSENEKLVNMMGKAFLEIYLSSEYEEEKIQ